MVQHSSTIDKGAEHSSLPLEMESFLTLADRWELTTDDQIKLLGSPGRSTFFKWKKSGGTLPNDTIERISHLLNIYKCLEIVLPNPTSADNWIKKQNTYFESRSALEVMLDGQVSDIYRVRQYLDAQRGG
jgi:hypothetical protein